MTGQFTPSSSNAQYEFMPPSKNYMGKPFSDWISEYVNWIIQPNPDRNNDGEVIFLRGFDIPTTSIEQMPKTVGPNFQDLRPVVRVGYETLVVPIDKPIFFPLVMALAESLDSKLDDNELCRRNYIRRLYSTEDPWIDQIKINGAPIDLPPDMKMRDFKVESNEFMINVPDVPYGTSLKDYMNTPLRTPGKRACVASGYFFMMKFAGSESGVVLHFKSNGERDRLLSGSDALYNIRIHKTMSQVISDRHLNEISEILENKKRTGKISEEEHDKLVTMIDKEKANISTEDKRIT